MNPGATECTGGVLFFFFVHWLLLWFASIWIKMKWIELNGVLLIDEGWLYFKWRSYCHDFKKKRRKKRWLSLTIWFISRADLKMWGSSRAVWRVGHLHQLKLSQQLRQWPKLRLAHHRGPWEGDENHHQSASDLQPLFKLYHQKVKLERKFNYALRKVEKQRSCKRNSNKSFYLSFILTAVILLIYIFKKLQWLIMIRFKQSRGEFSL